MMESYKKLVKVNKILVISIAIGILLFMAIAWMLIDMQGAMDPDFLPMIPNAYRYYLIVTICLLCLLISEMLFRNKMSAVISTLPLAEKLGVFRSAIIIRTAILEIAAFTVVVSALMWGEQNLNFAALLIIAAILYRFPTSDRMASALNLNRQEQQELGIYHSL